jgi:hypothetical protein
LRLVDAAPGLNVGACAQQQRVNTVLTVFSQKKNLQGSLTSLQPFGTTPNFFSERPLNEQHFPLTTSQQLACVF